MAGEEIEGDLWYQSLGRDLLPPSSCVDFRTLSPTSVQNLGRIDPHLTKIALYQALHSKSCVGLMYTKNGCSLQETIKLSLVWDSMTGQHPVLKK